MKKIFLILVTAFALVGINNKALAYDEGGNNDNPCERCGEGHCD